MNSAPAWTAASEAEYLVLMACHNRRSKTLSAIDAVAASLSRAGTTGHLYLFDDGSSDGTGAAVQGQVGTVGLTLLEGTGDCYWALSMSRAESAALADGRDDQTLLWLNDDVVLDVDAVERARHTSERGNRVCVGAMRDPVDSSITYSGFRKRGWHPLAFALVPPSSSHSTTVDTFNGNFVLVPVVLSREIGGIDGGFSHALADIDFGLRVRRFGAEVVLMEGSYGTCPRDNTLPQESHLRAWRRYRGVKGGMNRVSFLHFARRHQPYTGPVALCASYLKWWASRVVAPKALVARWRAATR